MEAGVTVVNATLVKRQTADGFFEMLDHVPLGKTYRVILESRQKTVGWNLPTGRVFEVEMILNADVMEWLPVELLAIADKEEA